MSSPNLQPTEVITNEVNVGQLADDVEGLVQMKIRPTLGLHKIDDPVQHELDEPENHEPGNQPHDSRLNQRVSRQAVSPERAGLIRNFREVGRKPMVFPNGKEIALKRVVAERMADDEREKQRPPRLVKTDQPVIQNHFAPVGFRWRPSPA